VFCFYMTIVLRGLMSVVSCKQQTDTEYCIRSFVTFTNHLLLGRLNVRGSDGRDM
jgi:hypothetical protein